MKDIFSLKTAAEEMKNVNVVFFDANFRAWIDETLKKNELTINCE